MPTEIDVYLAALPAAQRAVLQELREFLHAEIPGVEETIKTRVPALRYQGKTVVGFGAAARHVALYVMFGDALRALKDDFARFDATSRVVRFTPDAPLPNSLVRKVVRFRIAEIDARSARVAAKKARRRAR